MTCPFYDQMYFRCVIGKFDNKAKFIKGDDKWNFKHASCPLTEIVTCKDCKHYKHYGVNGYCSKRVNTDSHTDVYREPDYFCALGERSE